jgi:hypothetical protein
VKYIGIAMVGLPFAWFLGPPRSNTGLFAVFVVARANHEYFVKLTSIAVLSFWIVTLKFMLL